MRKLGDGLRSGDAVNSETAVKYRACEKDVFSPTGSMVLGNSLSPPRISVGTSFCAACLCGKSAHSEGRCFRHWAHSSVAALADPQQDLSGVNEARDCPECIGLVLSASLRGVMPGKDGIDREARPSIEVALRHRRFVPSIVLGISWP
jgi:hypothetical protein